MAHFILATQHPKATVFGEGSLSIGKDGGAQFFEGNADSNSPILASTERVRIEWAGHWIQFEAYTNGVPSATGELMDGAPVGVNAICRSGHAWRLRGVTCVDEIRNN